MPKLTADQALARLQEGNERFRNGAARGAGKGGAPGKDLVRRQTPFAVVLGCSDSRVPTEIVFDTGLGDLFVIRNAGNVAGPSSVASIEYAVSQLGSKLVVVMGHQNCGAVNAAIEGGQASKNLSRLLSYIEPALDPAAENIDIIGRRNARINADRLVEESDIIREATQGGLRIVTAFFSFTSGEVEFD